MSEGALRGPAKVMSSSCGQTCRSLADSSGIFVLSAAETSGWPVMVQTQVESSARKINRKITKNVIQISVLRY